VPNPSLTAGPPATFRVVGIRRTPTPGQPDAARWPATVVVELDNGRRLELDVPLASLNKAGVIAAVKAAITAADAWQFDVHSLA
jgi:hypothetical protein